MIVDKGETMSKTKELQELDEWKVGQEVVVQGGCG